MSTHNPQFKIRLARLAVPLGAFDPEETSKGSTWTAFPKEEELIRFRIPVEWIKEALERKKNQQQTVMPDDVIKATRPEIRFELPSDHFGPLPATSKRANDIRRGRRTWGPAGDAAGFESQLVQRLQQASDGLAHSKPLTPSVAPNNSQLLSQLKLTNATDRAMYVTTASKRRRRNEIMSNIKIDSDQTANLPAEQNAKPKTRVEKQVKTKKSGAAKPASKAKNQVQKPNDDGRNKKAEVVALMKRPKGVTLAEIVDHTGWQKHTVRGFVSILGKNGQKVESFKSAKGDRTYKISR